MAAVCGAQPVYEMSRGWEGLPEGRRVITEVNYDLWPVVFHQQQPKQNPTHLDNTHMHARTRTHTLTLLLLLLL